METVKGRRWPLIELVAGSAPRAKPGGVLWRVPHWRLVKLKRLCSLQRLQGAARAFAWAPQVVEGWHSRNMSFWNKEAATVDGMTGGWTSCPSLVCLRWRVGARSALQPEDLEAYSRLLWHLWAPKRPAGGVSRRRGALKVASLMH